MKGGKIKKHGSIMYLHNQHDYKFSIKVKFGAIRDEDRIIRKILQECKKFEVNEITKCKVSEGLDFKYGHPNFYNILYCLCNKFFKYFYFNLGLIPFCHKKWNLVRTI